MRSSCPTRDVASAPLEETQLVVSEGAAFLLDARTGTGAERGGNRKRYKLERKSGEQQRLQRGLLGPLCDCASEVTDGAAY